VCTGVLVHFRQSAEDRVVSPWEKGGGIAARVSLSRTKSINRQSMSRSARASQSDSVGMGDIDEGRSWQVMPATSY